MRDAQTLVSVEEYLSTVYQPDCDYVDGEVLERNMAEVDHSSIQGELIGLFYVRRKEWNVTILPEVRVQVKPTRFRIPDIAIVLGKTDEQILTKPPFLCIEILSPEDRWSRLQESIEDYFQFGVPEVWIIDPQDRKAWTCTQSAGARLVPDGILRWNDLAIELDQILPPRE